MFTGPQVVGLLEELGITHVTTVPDSTLGPWLTDLARSSIRVIQVCREGEAWTIAAGLYVGGARPLVMIQCTGLFESGDAVRNVIHDLKLPLYAIVGYRSFLNQSRLPGDTCLVFTEPTLKAWQLDYQLIERPDQISEIRDHYCQCQAERRPGVTLLAEGKS